MRIVKIIAIAFSLYSRIPMPSFDWDDEDYRHAVAVLPLIGVVIGALCFGVTKFYAAVSGEKELSAAPLVLILTAIPIFVTGGFHIDGFMDVSDAGNSFAEKERRLEIMKDPHIGAFAVIGLMKIGLFWLASLFLIVDDYLSSGRDGLILLFCIGFAVARAACGMTSIVFSRAKTDGMLSREVSKAGRIDLGILIKTLGIGLIIGLFIAPVPTVACMVALIVFVIYYRRFCYSKFGGVTGDTAGFFVVCAELVIVVMLALCSIVGV